MSALSGLSNQFCERNFSFVFPTDIATPLIIIYHTIERIISGVYRYAPVFPKFDHLNKSCHLRQNNKTTTSGGRTAMAARVEGIAGKRLDKAQYAENFADLHPRLTGHEALVEADRCYF